MEFDDDFEEEDIDDKPTAEDLAFIDDGSESGGEGPSFYRNVDLARVVSDQYLYSQLSPCGYPAITDKFQIPGESYRGLTENNSRYYGITDTFVVPT